MNIVLATLDNLYLDNTLNQWLVALLTASGVFLASILIRRVVRRHYARMAETEQVELMELPLQVASRTHTLFLIVMSAFFGMLTLKLPTVAHHFAERVLLIAVCWQFGLWATTGALAWIELKRRHSLSHDRAAAGTLGIIAIIIRMLIWAVVLLLTLDNLGINITTLVAGLGIGGIAIALAVQNVLGDLLASLSITLDKPFVLGDSLVVGDFKGKVEHIGIKSTRLRSVDGEQIIMPNADLLKSRVRNYGRMQERRVQFSIGVTYETPKDKLASVPAIVRAIVEAQSEVRLDRCHLARLGAFSVDYEVVYYVLSADYNQYMDIQQDINLRIYAAFAEQQIEFAYPTQKLWLSNADNAPSSPTSDA